MTLDAAYQKQGDLPEEEFLDGLAEQDRALRPERLAFLRQKISELFPAQEQAPLRASIEESLSVPQFGTHHNEGGFMDAHLALILHRLEDAEKGIFPDALPEKEQMLIQETIPKYREVLVRYAFLHDIAKKDCLTLKYATDGVKRTREVTWEEWKSEIPSEAQSDPVSLRKFCKEQGITGISYYHESTDEARGNHGAVGKNDLEKRSDLGVPAAILTAIEKHEVAYLFTTVAPATYQKHFDTLSDEERSLALVGSYIDTAGSLRKNGKPDFSNFIALCDSRHNADFIKLLQRNLTANTELDQRKVSATLTDLLKRDRRITETLEEMMVLLQKKCAPDVFEEALLRVSLTPLVERAVITAAEMQTIIERLLVGDAKAVGVQFGKKMRDLKPAIEAGKK